MAKPISAAASELLELEKAQLKRPFSDTEQARWEELIVQIFYGDSGEKTKRKSFRIQSSTKCFIRQGETRFDCELVEISLLGFAFVSKLFKADSNGVIFYLESVQVDGQKIQLGLECKTAGLTTPENKGKFGAEISRSNSLEALGIFHEKVYYPHYIRHLEDLKGS